MWKLLHLCYHLRLSGHDRIRNRMRIRLKKSGLARYWHFNSYFFVKEHLYKTYMISKQYNNVSLTSKSTINISWNIKKIEYLMLEPLNHPLFPLWIKYYFREQSILKLFSSDRILYFCNRNVYVKCAERFFACQN